MNLEEKLEELVLRNLPNEQYFLTELQAKQAGSNTKISIFLDGDKGIDIDVCAQVSRKVGSELEALELMKNAYTLMVSSPGLDRPLILPRQYFRNKGKKVKIKLTSQEEIEGKLREVHEEFIVLDELPVKQAKTQKEKIPFTEIETTHVLASF